MAIEDDIVALLQSPEVQKIRFVAEAIRIGGDRYKAVAKKLKEGLVTVDIDPDLDDDDDNPRDGKYNPHTDTVTLMKDALVTIDDKRIAVHEMTHAVIDDLDLPRSRGLSHYEAEGIAYIAAALYIRFVGGPAVDDTDDAACAGRRCNRQERYRRGPHPLCRDTKRNAETSQGNRQRPAVCRPCGSPAVQRRHLITTPLPRARSGIRRWDCMS